MGRLDDNPLQNSLMPLGALLSSKPEESGRDVIDVVRTTAVVASERKPDGGKVPLAIDVVQERRCSNDDRLDWPEM